MVLKVLYLRLYASLADVNWSNEELLYMLYQQLRSEVTVALFVVSQRTEADTEGGRAVAFGFAQVDECDALEPLKRRDLP